MTNSNHPDSRRGDATTFIALNLLGLAGLLVLVACLSSDSGLWPSFSGERVYAAAAYAPGHDWPSAPPTLLHEARPAEPAPVHVSASRTALDDACGERARKHVRAEREARRQQQQQTTPRRVRLLSRRRPAPLTTTVVDG